MNAGRQQGQTLTFHLEAVYNSPLIRSLLPRPFFGELFRLTTNDWKKRQAQPHAGETTAKVRAALRTLQWNRVANHKPTRHG